MISYITTKDETRCCGCKACFNVCPKQAISFEKNTEGFEYPVIDADKCISCSLCSDVCPYDTEVSKQNPIEIYAFQNIDEQILSESSSGGMFRLISDYVMAKNGFVVGAVINEDYSVGLKITDDVAIVEKMMGSKYVYCDPKSIYKDVKEKLLNDDYVLFTGSPCQCAALRNYLKHDYNKLIVADFLCHGMPSNKAFSYYVDTIKKPDEQLTEIKFRDKSKKGWGKAFSYYVDTIKKPDEQLTELTFQDKSKKGWGKTFSRWGRKHISWESTNSYLYAFQSGFLNRYSCYSCKFRGKDRFTDFTFSDYWGVEQFHPEIDSRKGVSAVSINTEKALQIKKELGQNANWIPTKREYVAKGGNAAILDCSDVEKINPVRKVIYTELESFGWNGCTKKYFRPEYYLIKKIWYSLPVRLTKVIKTLYDKIGNMH